MIKLTLAKFTCPFCFRRYNPNKIQYKCPDCGQIAQSTWFKFEPIACKSAGCGGGRQAILRTCPGCGGEIPRTALQTPNLPFSIVGVTGSGKTNYITVMLQELKNQGELSLNLAPLTDSTRHHHSENRDLIYTNRHTPGNTLPGKIEPQIWSISNLNRQNKRHTPKYTFTIFDGAGEEHEQVQNASVSRYINASKAIILVIDPLNLLNIQQKLDPLVIKNSSPDGKIQLIKEAGEVINNVAEYIKTARGINPDRVLDIPVAVVLTKFDLLLDDENFAPNALIKQDSLTIRDGKVDETEFKQIHEEIESWLNRNNESGFINALKSHFNEFYFFGVSSLGAAPKDGSNLENNIKPHRVLDPILWLFKKKKFID